MYDDDAFPYLHILIARFKQREVLHRPTVHCFVDLSSSRPIDVRPRLRKGKGRGREGGREVNEGEGERERESERTIEQ